MSIAPWLAGDGGTRGGGGKCGGSKQQRWLAAAVARSSGAIQALSAAARSAAVGTHPIGVLTATEMSAAANCRMYSSV